MMMMIARRGSTGKYLGAMPPPNLGAKAASGEHRRRENRGAEDAGLGGIRAATIKRLIDNKLNHGRLWNRAGHYIFILWFLLLSFFFFSVA